jgi:hypothetical protein
LNHRLGLPEFQLWCPVPAAQAGCRQCN